MIHRLLRFPETSSFFLFGPRQTGKSTLVDAAYTQGVWKVDLLLSDELLLFSRSPHLFRLQAVEKIVREGITTIFVDEIQRQPLLLTEVHWLIEKYPQCRFILTGSSARKLRRKGVDLLAGRAVERHLFPYVYDEIRDTFDLDRVLRFGTLPGMWGRTEDEVRDRLTAYVHAYLQQEIMAEGVSRNLGGFSRFLEVAAAQSGELVNVTAISRDCALQARTVQGYYDILEDTLMGFKLEAWGRSVRKRLSAHPKFYLFDTGVINAVNRRLQSPPDPLTRGRLFEHFVVLETWRLRGYLRSEARLFFWRAASGAEVDLLIEKHGRIVAACEIKSSSSVDGTGLSGLRSFAEEYPDVPRTVVAAVADAYEIGGIRILPWQRYLETLREWL